MVLKGIFEGHRPKELHGHVQVIMLVLLSLLTAMAGASVGPEPVVIIMWLDPDWLRCPSKRPSKLLNPPHKDKKKRLKKENY